MMIPLLGAAFGIGLTVLVLGMRPPRANLRTLLRSLEAPAIPNSEASRAGRSWAVRLGSPGVPMAKALGWPPAAVRADLEVCGTDVEVHLAEKTACAVAGLIAPWLALGVYGVGVGRWPGSWMSLATSVIFAAVLFFVPDLAIRQRARDRQAQMRHTLALVLDLTVIALAGGAGVHQALQQATEAPRGWAASKLRHAWTLATTTRTSPWRHMAEVGRKTHVPELCEIASTLDLAGSEGAKIRVSLDAKARAMRKRRLADLEGEAQAATERMSLPLVGLFAAFLILIGYPALAHVLTM
ncbi:type II secretion protein F [Streptomyces sp. AJS327]|nr:type II secretion protein F [Streptomyces sp. AJS327]